MAKNDLHDQALILLGRINSEIPDPERVATLNSMMTLVIRELNGQLIDDIIPKAKKNDTK
jgi:hypothetical protein